MQKLLVVIVSFCFLYKPGNSQNVKQQDYLGKPWNDMDGNFINAHGAGILHFGDVYYMFGEIKKGSTRLVPGQNWEDYRVPAGGISCYSSRDLIKWKFEGVALMPKEGDSLSDLDTARVIERPKVIYNAVTKKFVMWMHMDKEDYSYARTGVAVSDKPEGPYKYLGSFQPNGQQSRDMTIFKDEDGKAYLIYASEDNNTMHVCRLSDDYLNPTNNFTRILINQRREAPAIFKHLGKYYLITSLCSGWIPNAALYSVADSLTGKWENKGNPCIGPGAETTFEAQSSFVLTLDGNADSYIFLADKWNKTDLPDSRYLWLPLRVAEGKVEIINNKYSDEGHFKWKTNSELTIDSMEVLPYSVLQYSVNIKNNQPHAKGYSYIKFYDISNRELLSYRTDPISSRTFVESIIYTEAPPLTKYVKIGIASDSLNPDSLYADSLKLQLNIGTPAKPQTPNCNLDEYMRPFWKSDTIYNETVLMYSESGMPAMGKLLFKPDHIISVKSYDLSREYKKGIDYTIHDNSIIKSKHSDMSYRTDSSFDHSDLAWYNLQSQWIVVTYTHHDKWTGPLPVYKGDKLPLLMAKLKSKLPVKIIGYGMSITRGQDVSSYVNRPPFMPTYLDLFARQLRENYHHDKIELLNAGLPGALVSWGASYAEKYINPVHPDLVIIDFGMNDFWRYTPDEYKGFIQTIINKVKNENPKTEFLLISNMDFDPSYILDSDKYKSFYTSNMKGYNKVLQQLETTGVTNLDMTTLSDSIYFRKKAKDCISNPLHPNDYLARWYAQSLTAMLSR
jgi:Glycosyl hydrolases family 43/GDSL-like Lipase/Acylhydrolase family